MKELINTPIFGIIISIAAFEIGLLIQKKTKIAFLNPLFIGMVLIIVFLLGFKVDIAVYNKGGDLISTFIGPATVVLAVPLYKQIEHLKANIIPIIGGIIIGCVTSVGSVFLFAKLFNLTQVLALSLVAKSVTTPIGIEISKQLGGIPAITMGGIVIAGLVGAVMGPFICRVFKITDKIAIGIAIGTSSHALGTTKAVELGETEGAMSGLAIGVAGVVTVFIASFLVKFI